eukprot:403331548
MSFLQNLNEISADSIIYPGQMLKIVNHNPANQHLLITQEQLDNQNQVQDEGDLMNSNNLNEEVLQNLSTASPANIQVENHSDSLFNNQRKASNASDANYSTQEITIDSNDLSKNIHRAQSQSAYAKTVDLNSRNHLTINTQKTELNKSRKGSMNQPKSPAKVLNQDDITSEFQKLQMGYHHMQEQFQKVQKREENDILRLFGKLTQQANNNQISEIDRIQLQYFIEHQPDKIKSEGYYCTSNGKVKGVFTLTEHLIMFDPIKCQENEQFQYQAIIDIQDIVSCQKIRTENQTAEFIQDPEIKKYYKYDYFIQINLSQTDGLNLQQVLKSTSIDFDREESKSMSSSSQHSSANNNGSSTFKQDQSQRQGHDPNHVHTTYHKKSILPIAIVFFRFSHRDKENEPLTNKKQKLIVDGIYQTLLRYIEKNSILPRSIDGSSSTSVKFYDKLQQGDKVPTNLEDHMQKQHYNKSTFVISASLPEFKTIMKNQSEIVDEASRKLITYFLPGLIRMREWRLLFSINQDGVSMQTFYTQLRNRDNTLVLVKDENDRVFGAYCCEEWRIKSGFYGRGESFVFYFDDEEDIKVFSYTGKNERIQYSDETSLMIGGGNSAAVFITDQFKNGRSGNSETFDNEILSKEPNFTCKQFEVWGFDFI